MILKGNSTTAVATRTEGKNLKYIFFFYLCVYWECFCSELDKMPTTRGPCNRSRREVSEEHALLALFLHGWRTEDGPNGLVEHSLKAALSQGRALQVLDGSCGSGGKKRHEFNIKGALATEKEARKKPESEVSLQISLAMASPWGYVIGLSFFSFSLSMVSLSSLRSSLVPTRMMGVLGQWCLTSGYHCKHTSQPV